MKMPDTDSIREALEALCLKFEKDKTHYLSKGYPESQVRVDFLNPLFNILGWNIENTAQKPPHERDVIVEASSEATGRPDYNFRYYTPKYIVDYIVKNTVGRAIEGKTPKQIEKIRILDPACGSGSFLLGAYQYLIDYHPKYYREHPKQARTLYYDPYYKIKPDEITLPIQEKARILKNNLFGVDKDPQAVEITMMSLYLKAIEGERGFLPMRQHLLPPLTYNIVCGNSLVGYDMFEGRLFDDANNPLSPPLQ